MPQDKLPGVTLHMEGSKVVKAVGDKLTAKIFMSAIVEDAILWNAVQEKLKEGLKIYTIDDFKTEMIKAVNEELEKEKVLTTELRHKVQQLEYERGTLRVELSKKQEILDKLNTLSLFKVD
jgi:dynactin complex subunit